MNSTVSAATFPPFRLVGDCPNCTHPLVVRHTHQGRQPFIGCSAYPACRFTCEYDAAMAQLGQQMADLRQGWWSAHQREQALDRQLQLARGQGPQGISPRALDGELLGLIALCHPDKWANSPVATELSKAVLALRQRVKEGRV